MNSVYRLRGQLAAARRNESASLDEMAQRGAEPSSPRLLDESAGGRADGADPARKVPGRS